VARDWEEASTLSALEARLEQVAPGNTADLPIAAAKERQPDGSFIWTVDIHVRIPRVTEYDVTGVGKSFAGALRRAYLGLNNEAGVRGNADRANAQFGIAA